MSRMLNYLLRSEAMLFFTVFITLAIHFLNGLTYWQFLIVFFIPDISLLGYLYNKKVGAVAYNLMHSTVLPFLALISMLVLYGASVLQYTQSLGLLCLWLSHIGFDRALGYGLKEFKGFHYTHLGVIGKSSAAPEFNS